MIIKELIYEKKHLYLTALLLTCFSCQQDDLIIDNIHKDLNNISGPVSLTEEGYLEFDSQMTFDDYINSFREDAESATRSALVKSIPGFISIKN